MVMNIPQSVKDGSCGSVESLATMDAYELNP